MQVGSASAVGQACAVLLYKVRGVQVLVNAVDPLQHKAPPTAAATSTARSAALMLVELVALGVAHSEETKTASVVEVQGTVYV